MNTTTRPTAAEILDGFTEPPTLDDLKAALRTLGYTPSAGCWESDRTAFAFSAECLEPATYGAAAIVASYCRVTRWATIGRTSRKF